MQSFSLQYFVTLGAGATTNCCRVMLVRDLQNQGTTITAADVLETVGVSTAPVTYMDYVNGPFSNKRFSIVYDHIFTLDTYHPIAMDVFKSNHDCHVAFRDGTSAVTGAGNGSYFLVAISSDTATNPALNFSTRMVYTDN